jgi:MoaA/NifB/PqqE/SkfB family radical SAM enzyme
MNLPVLGAAPASGATPWVGPNGRIMERLELHLTYTCPERCAFCSEAHRMERYKQYAVTWGRIATVLREHAARGVTSVHLTGGEPTIHPQFVETLALAKKHGMRTSVGTIGSMLSRRDFAERALPFLDEGLFSLHGPCAEVHDALAGRPQSFERTTRALELCLELKPGFGGYVNTVLTRHNADALPDTVRLARRLGASLVVVSNTTPEGAGYDRYAELAVPLETLATVLPAAAAAAEGMTLRFFGVPMCLLGEYAAYSNDLHWDPRVTVEWGDGPGSVIFGGIYSWAPDRKRVHVKECDGCRRRGVCAGVFDRYAELFPTDRLTAERGGET